MKEKAKNSNFIWKQYSSLYGIDKIHYLTVRSQKANSGHGGKNSVGSIRNGIQGALGNTPFIKRTGASKEVDSQGFGNLEPSPYWYRGTPPLFTEKETMH